MNEKNIQKQFAAGNAPKLTPSILDEGEFLVGNVYVRRTLRRFCANPPLLPTESAETYCDFIVRLAAQVKGDDLIGDFLVQDVVDGVMAVQRVKKIQANWIALQAERVGAEAGKKGHVGDPFLAKIDAWQQANSPQKSVEMYDTPTGERDIGKERERSHELSSDDKVALAFMATIESHEQLDRMLERLSARRDAALRQLELHLARQRIRAKAGGQVDG